MKMGITMKKNALLISSAIIAASFVAQAAQAKTIDYGSLQELFGEPVTLGATGSPIRASDAPVAMQIITADEIRRSAATNIPAILARFAGVSARQSTFGDTEIGIRGYNSAFNPRLLVLVNGRQVYQDSYGYTIWDALPIELSEIRQIEIVKGPNTALFGLNAVSGVVNIITYNAIYDDFGSVAAQGGNDSYYAGSMVKSFKTDKLGLRLSLGTYDTDEFDTAAATPTYLASERETERGSVALEGIFELTPNVHVGLEGTYANLNRVEQSPTLTLLSSEYDNSSIKGFVTADSSIGLVKATAYLNLSEAELISVTAGPPSTLPLDTSTTVVQIEDILKIGKSHTVRGAVEYRSNKFEGAFLPPGGELSYDLFAFGVMWNWAASDTVSLTNAIRLDLLELSRSTPSGAGDAAFDIDLDQVSINSGLVWKPTGTDTIRLSFGQGAQLPSLVELAATPTAEALVVRNYEIGYDRVVAKLNGVLRTAIFHQTNEGIRSLGVVGIGPGGLILAVSDIGDSDMWGGEASFDWSINESWSAGVNYTYTSISDDLANSIGPVFTSAQEFENSNSDHVANVSVSYTKDKWEFDVNARYASAYDGLMRIAPVFTPSKVDAYTTVSARIAHKLTDGITLSVAGENLGSDAFEQVPGTEVQRRFWIELRSAF